MLIERSHFVIGLVVGVLLLAGGAYALTLQAGALAAGDDVLVELADADRLEAGAPVRIAGVRVGQVMGVEIAGDRVHATVRTPEALPADTRARITTTNALGARAITLEPGDEWDALLNDEPDPVIPLERTEAFVDLPDVTDETVAVLEEADTEAAARLFTSLADVTEDQHDEVGALLDGLEEVGGVVADNRVELEGFLDDAGELLEVLNDADGDLLRTIDGMGEAVAALDARRDDLLEFVRATAETSATTADLVEEERETIDAILDEVAGLLAVVDDHQVDLAHLVGYVGVAFEGFATVGESQGEDNPYWGDIFTTGFGAVGVDAVAGCGGLLDELLDQLLGPGPDCPGEEQSALEPDSGLAPDGDMPGPDELDAPIEQRGPGAAGLLRGIGPAHGTEAGDGERDPGAGPADEERAGLGRFLGEALLGGGS